MTLKEIKLLIAKALESQKRRRLLNLSENILCPTTSTASVLLIAPPLNEHGGVTDIHITYESERMSDNSLALLDIKINDVSVIELGVKLNIV